MKCRLCDRPTAGPDKLCGDCSRALRRAREGSAALRKLPTPPAGRVEAAAAAVAPRTLTLTSAPPPGWRRRVAWAAAGLVAIGIVYLAQREPDRGHGPDAVVVDRSPRPLAERADTDAAPVPARLEAQWATARAKSAEIPAPPATPQVTAGLNAAQGSAFAASTQAPVRAKTGTRAGTTATNVERGTGSSSSAYAPGSDAAPGNSKAANSLAMGASLQLAQASGSPSAASMDDAQALASARKKCGEEKFLAAFVCEQKAYVQYCEGKWGEIPQCPIRQRGD